jgi:serine/threonine protein kinase
MLGTYRQKLIGAGALGDVRLVIGADATDFAAQQDNLPSRGILPAQRRQAVVVKSSRSTEREQLSGALHGFHTVAQEASIQQWMAGRGIAPAVVGLVGFAPAGSSSSGPSSSSAAGSPAPLPYGAGGQVYKLHKKARRCIARRRVLGGVMHHIEDSRQQQQWGCNTAVITGFMMPAFDGSLQSLIDDGLLTSRETMELLHKAIDLLDEAHTEGFSHFDVKFENILASRINDGLWDVKVSGWDTGYLCWRAAHCC